MVTPSEKSGAPASEKKSDPQPRQTAVYREYLRLQSIAERRFGGLLAGRLVLSAGFGPRRAELALATTIAGGAFLGVESDSNRLKAAVRNGSCDFMVNTLDEALRVLKNELRKHTPLSAGLLADASDVFPAMVERGVQPDLIADTTSAESTYLPAIDKMVERGAERLKTIETSDDSVSEEVSWTAANPQDLRRMDRVALDLIAPEDRIRRRWLEHAAGSFYRQIPLERVLWLEPEERDRLLDAFQRANIAVAFQMPAAVRWTDSDGTERAVTL